MISPSPRKRKLRRLSLKARQESNEEDNMRPNKCQKTDSPNAELGVRKNNFMKACLQVSFAAYKDYNKRFQLAHLPECINNICIHGDKDQNITQILQSVEESYKIDMRNKTWIEALEICLKCITPKQYLSANALKDIVEIMMSLQYAKLKLTRVNSQAGQYAAALLKIGEDCMPTDSNDMITLRPEFCQIVDTTDDVKNNVYPDLQINMSNQEWLCERAILAPTNEIVNQINERIMSDVDGDVVEYLSVDNVMDTEQVTSYPTEFVNSLELSGVPSYKLRLKVGVPVLLMRNLDAPRLCNGTRLQITHLGHNIIKATIMTGMAKGENVLIPRIPIIPTDLPFQFKRVQFPLKAAFAITINKAQGQTLTVAGVHLEKKCFSHGQLYVAFSRVSNPQNLYILAIDGKTKKNAHEDLYTDYTIDSILRKCQNTLKLHFTMHPPCLTKGIRDCYKNFLVSSMDWKENKLSNRKLFCSDEGIVSYCFNRLLHDIRMENPDGILINEQEIPAEIDGVRQLHWEIDNLEMFELLERSERIERCMLVLESVVFLLQTDLALWHARRISTADSQRRSQRPLVSYLLWPHNFLTYGTVTRQCEKIMELFAYYIHLKYPDRHIKTMSLWINVVVEMFYMYDTRSGIDFPNTSSYCSVFAKRFHRVISPLPNASISRILKRVQPSFMQYLLGKHHIQNILNSAEDDILYIMIWCVKNVSWDNFPKGDQQPKICKKSMVKPDKLLDYLSRECSRRSFKEASDLAHNVYPKLELREKDSSIILQDYLIDILSTTFVAYLDAHNIKKFHQILERYNSNQYTSDPMLTSYSITDNFIKTYRSIVHTLKELVILKEKVPDEPTKKLTELINVYFL